MTIEALQRAETSILEHLRKGEPVSVVYILDQLERDVAPSLVRRAVWSLVAKGKLELTANFSLLKSS